ncbi:LCP family protein [Streptomyces sp. BH104]|uniref:LCP family protein n=1 Tax=Streptomyces sp. BH104 TaxID=3410407 RepID=UPI003BB7E357
MPDPPAPCIARPAAGRRRALWCTAVLLRAAVALGGWGLYRRLDRNLATTDIGARSDTTMLLHVYGDRKHATVVSIPRDTVVDRPACPRPHGRTAPEVGAAMFNTAYGVGGSARTVKTVEHLSRIRVDHVVEVDFTGFKRLIDVIGGVEVTTDQNIHDPKSGLDLAAGTHRLHGEQTLALVGIGADTIRFRTLPVKPYPRDPNLIETGPGSGGRTADGPVDRCP